MRLRAADIPSDGLELEFCIGHGELNDRVRPSEEGTGSPFFCFEEDPRATLKVYGDGATVIVNGNANIIIRSDCARCSELARREMSVPLQLVLKPFSSKLSLQEQVEDVSVDYYKGEDIDLAELLQDFILLALPYRMFCNDDCKGLCVKCGKNLNEGLCSCKEDPPGDDRWSVLKTIKVL